MTTVENLFLKYAAESTLALFQGSYPPKALDTIGATTKRQLSDFKAEGERAYHLFLTDMLRTCIGESISTPNLVTTLRHYFIGFDFMSHIETVLSAPALKLDNTFHSIIGILPTRERASWLADLFRPIADGLYRLALEMITGNTQDPDVLRAMIRHNAHKRQRSDASRNPAVPPGSTFEWEFRTAEVVAIMQEPSEDEDMTSTSDNSFGSSGSDGDSLPIFSFQNFWTAPIAVPSASSPASEIEDGELVEEPTDLPALLRGLPAIPEEAEPANPPAGRMSTAVPKVLVSIANADPVKPDSTGITDEKKVVDPPAVVLPVANALEDGEAHARSPTPAARGTVSRLPPPTTPPSASKVSLLPIAGAPSDPPRTPGHSSPRARMLEKSENTPPTRKVAHQGRRFHPYQRPSSPLVFFFLIFYNSS
ncbi:hypothetical protein MVEN_00216800 [Mycena venus]|uniref:Uncharacterized protein n=1 Tax=Mycena venus TaxID=2733690 RepID=A0A8H7DE81_9AGAR|nr:hypothetical protein MVEN_00216800 [Mycena venus]